MKCGLETLGFLSEAWGMDNDMNMVNAMADISSE